MKRSILMLMAIAVALIFFGCAKEEILAPEVEQDAMEESALKGAKKATEFTGTSAPILVPPISEGTTMILPNGKTKLKGMTAEWYDEASDLRVTGKSIWVVNSITEAENPFNRKMWGSAEIFVGVKHPDDPNYDPNDLPTGRWDIKWHGYMTPSETPGHFTIDVDATGVGKSGEVKGLTAKWKYIFDTEVAPYYITEGYIK